VLLSLCKAAPLVDSTEPAKQLFDQLSPYLPESPTQAITSSPRLRNIEPSPHEALTFSLTFALLSIGLKHESLEPKVASSMYKYVEGWSQLSAPLAANQLETDEATDNAADGELSKVMTLVLSLLGFLDAASQQARFWDPQERLRLVVLLRDALTDKFMVVVETAQSVVRNSRVGQRGLKEWRRISKHYAAQGRPLGSMILRQAFMRFVVSCAALVVCPADQGLRTSVLDYLQINSPGSDFNRDPAENELMDRLADVASDEMEFLQSESDYIQRVGSAWQQRLASAVRANIYRTFLCCASYNVEIVDPETLMTWLETSISDPVQMTDEHLATVVLKCLPVLAKLSPAIAASLGRSVPRIIVQGGLESRAAAGAADSLVKILKLLPEDTVITTIYSLGNVLSAQSISEKSNMAVAANGTHKARQGSAYQQPHETTGSTISLSPSDADEPSQVYSTVIRTVVGIVRSRNDEKITALALSMLIQKIGRVSLAVDAMIIMETALLAAHAAATELKSLLKLYTKLSHDALLKDNVVMLDAVCPLYSIHKVPAYVDKIRR
jgi:phosphatidylinositol 4-kinase A